MTKKRYETDRKAAKALAEALKGLPDNFLVCRDVAHAWAVENDFYDTPMATEGRKAGKHVSRDLVCMRCETTRHERYLDSLRYGLVKIGQTYKNPAGYAITGVPRGVKPQHIVRQEQYQRAMKRKAAAKTAKRKRVATA